MRKSLFSLFILSGIAALYTLTSCKSETPSQPAHDDTLHVEAQPDTTIYGNYIDGGMSSLRIIDDSGDTLEFVLETLDKTTEVKGGLYSGDKLAIIKEEVDGENYAATVINITSLIGKWADLARRFEIEDGGTVCSDVEAETKPLVSWKIHNGRLLLNTDTFDILKITHDTLSIENHKGIYNYKRQQS